MGVTGVRTPQPTENGERTGYEEGSRVGVVKSNHLLWRNGDRVPIAPKGFDVLAYLVDHAGRVVTQKEILEASWTSRRVNTAAK